jgi:hypothetical protein
MNPIQEIMPNTVPTTAAMMAVVDTALSRVSTDEEDIFIKFWFVCMCSSADQNGNFFRFSSIR